MTVQRADVCVLACADAWRGDGEILCSAFGVVPALGARLAKATFEPGLLIEDDEGRVLAGIPPLFPEGCRPGEVEVEGWLPVRTVFDFLWSGRRHVMMGASQVDRHGNQNISCIGDWARPRVQLVGSRGAPGNTVSHPTSYWVPSHTPRTLVERVDFVSGVGYDRAERAGAGRRHEVRRVVTNLGVFDFATPDHRMRVRSLHPGVTREEVAQATGFDLVFPEDVPASEEPGAAALALIERLDPGGLRYREVPAGAPA